MANNEFIIAPYLTSPLANSTKVNSIYGEERIKQAYHYYPFRKDIDSRPGFNITCPVRKESKVKFKDITVDNIYNESIKPLISMPSPIEPLSTKEDKDIKVSIVSCISEENKEAAKCEPATITVTPTVKKPEEKTANTSRKSLGSTKPVVARKSVVARRTSEPIKASDNKNRNNALTVEKILKTIKMTKYQHSFKKINLAKFKELKEIDLNAFGITRQSEIRIFKEAIDKAKMDLFFI
ncbi:hypothetical protein DOY81_001166 [Sarcophaga bullata]|nr:hypothetical protein DOY81_001166 [Sarcophaga bullata]